MRTGVSYMGHHNPKHLKTDLWEMKAHQIDDVLVAAQENDFVHFTGKLDFTPAIAREAGVRPLAIFWGALNLFGGGRSSQFLLENPSAFQQSINGSQLAEGCSVNPLSVARIKEMLDIIAERGFAGYFIDEPTPQHACYCSSCRSKFAEWYGSELKLAPKAQQDEFRQRCVIAYIQDISDYCKANHPQLETICCLMPHDDQLWQQAADIAGLDNLGTDLYWINNDRDTEEMAEPVRYLDALCKEKGKTHHEWLQCWNVAKGREQRIIDQGKILIRENPDALYIWAWYGQVGTSETCADPVASWEAACQILAEAKKTG